MLEAKAEKFLGALEKPSTRRCYRIALDKFALFYSSFVPTLNDSTIDFELDKFLTECGKTVDGFLQAVNLDYRRDLLEKQKVAETVLKGFVASLKAEGLSRKSVRTYCSAAQNLGLYWELPLTLKHTGLPRNTVQTETYVWTLPKVEKFISLMKSQMYATLSTVLFQSGLSLSDALTLTYGDIAEEFETHVCPLCLNFQKEGRRKTGNPFLTFVGGWSVSSLQQYLAGKNLGAVDLLFPVTEESVDSYFRTIARTYLGYKWKGRNPASPHSLRHGFKTLLKDSKTIELKDVEFFLAHDLSGDMDSIYTSRDIPGWRKIYSAGEPFLTPTPQPTPISVKVSV